MRTSKLSGTNRRLARGITASVGGGMRAPALTVVSYSLPMIGAAITAATGDEIWAGGGVSGALI